MNEFLQLNKIFQAFYDRDKAFWNWFTDRSYTLNDVFLSAIDSLKNGWVVNN